MFCQRRKMSLHGVEEMGNMRRLLRSQPRAFHKLRVTPATPEKSSTLLRRRGEECHAAISTSAPVQMRNFKSTFLEYREPSCPPGNRLDGLAEPPKHGQASTHSVFRSERMPRQPHERLHCKLLNTLILRTCKFGIFAIVLEEKPP